MKQTATEWLIKELRKNRIVIPMAMEQQAKEMERDQKIAFGKKCFYEGFEKAENDDANCFTAWRESVDKLLTFKSE